MSPGITVGDRVLQGELADQVARELMMKAGEDIFEYDRQQQTKKSKWQLTVAFCAIASLLSLLCAISFRKQSRTEITEENA